MRRQPKLPSARIDYVDVSRNQSAGSSPGAGDAIVVTELDHHANIDPWRALERERGVTILQVPMIPETGELDWACA